MHLSAFFSFLSRFSQILFVTKQQKEKKAFQQQRRSRRRRRRRRPQRRWRRPELTEKGSLGVAARR